jgi:hypothetical protein
MIATMYSQNDLRSVSDDSDARTPLVRRAPSSEPTRKYGSTHAPFRHLGSNHLPSMWSYAVDARLLISVMQL